MKDDFAIQLLENMNEFSFDGIPEFADEMSAWEIVSAVRHMLPPHEEKILDFIFV